MTWSTVVTWRRAASLNQPTVMTTDNRTSRIPLINADHTPNVTLPAAARGAGHQKLATVEFRAGELAVSPTRRAARACFLIPSRIRAL